MADLQLDTLESKGLIRLAAYQPEVEYLFRHALVQDAAYESLLKQERRSLHALVGETLEELYPDRVTELAAILGMHFEAAGQGEKALRYLRAAADYAYDRNAIVEAYELYGRAQNMLPPAPADGPDPRGRERVEIGLRKARAGFSFRGSDLIATFAQLALQARELGDLRLEAEALLDLALYRQFGGEQYETSPELRRALDRAAELARQLDDPFLGAMPRSLTGLAQVFSGRLREGTAALRETAPLLEQKHDSIGSSFALMALAIGLARLGEFDEADKAAQKSAEIAERGDVIAKIDARIGLSQVHSIRGDVATAIPILQDCSSLAESTGAVACLVSSSFLLGDAFMRNDDFGSARIAFERGSQVADVSNEALFRPTISAYLRSTLASMANFNPVAVQSWDEALAEARERGDTWSEANIIWKRAETEAKRGDGANVEQMLGDFETAFNGFEAMGARPFEARVLRGWGEALLARDRADQGRAKLGQALSLFDALGIAREAGEVRVEL
jgi:tetratricopeptide (TPR) repeat protein